MKVAVTYDNGEVFQHFGHTRQFMFYEIDDGKIANEQLIDTEGQGHGALAGFLQNAHVDVLICGGIGAGAQEALAEVGIKLYGGVTGKAADAVAALLRGTLAYDPAVHCDHHHDEAHEDGHVCGEVKHGCSDSCHR